jgi:hypothetical protein
MFSKIDNLVMGSFMWMKKESFGTSFSMRMIKKMINRVPILYKELFHEV